MSLGPIISRLFTCSNAEKKQKKTKGACSSPISMTVSLSHPSLNVLGESGSQLLELSLVMVSTVVSVDLACKY